MHSVGSIEVQSVVRPGVGNRLAVGVTQGKNMAAKEQVVVDFIVVLLDGAVAAPGCTHASGRKWIAGDHVARIIRSDILAGNAQFLICLADAVHDIFVGIRGLVGTANMSDVGIFDSEVAAVGRRSSGAAQFEITTV